ncbi:hypothetical protein E2C01_046369 [Portunus trituberculatus]|uniref:Uncharacterized protein n=1 Tax=Portunus trituberculatus TaxID=210409 RepID=A0A5B7G4K4_PORTR|nr:hypothetical protein [Portunus trituberculatus]
MTLRYELLRWTKTRRASLAYDLASVGWVLPSTLGGVVPPPLSPKLLLLCLPAARCGRYCCFCNIILCIQRSAAAMLIRLPVRMQANAMQVNTTL